MPGPAVDNLFRGSLAVPKFIYPKEPKLGYDQPQQLQRGGQSAGRSCSSSRRSFTNCYSRYDMLVVGEFSESDQVTTCVDFGTHDMHGLMHAYCCPAEAGAGREERLHRRHIIPFAFPSVVGQL